MAAQIMLLSVDSYRDKRECRYSDYPRLMADDNTVIYGHNMKNSGMFGILKNFAIQNTGKSTSTSFPF